MKWLIREIHRRSLWQVLGIYLLGSWAGFEIIQTLTEGLGLPGWFPAFALVLFIIGLPIVLATAFVQEGVSLPSRDDPTLLPELKGPQEAPSGDADRSTSTGVGRLFNWRNAILGGLLAFSLWGLVATGWLIFGDRTSDAARVATRPDPNVVAVFPFRVSGAESEFGHLREGMVDLLAAKFNGEGGPRAADPRSVIAAWQRVAGPEGEDAPQEALLDVARDLGAGQVLLGGIVATPAQLVLNARVLAVPEGTVEAEASVEGLPDSLLALIDALTARLLVREAGESASRLASLTSRSLPALRAYLEGQAAYRRGAYERAVDHFDRALALDSTFALAGLAQISAANWTAGIIGIWDAIERVWGSRDRLSERDRRLLEAWAGPRYPDFSPAVELLAAWDRALAAAPERPEPWVESGDILFHLGPLLPSQDPWARAAAHFRRALDLDSTFTTPLIHLTEIEIVEGRREEVERLGARYLQIDSGGDLSEFMRWRIAHALGDSAGLARLRSRFSEMSTGSLIRIVGVAQLDGFALQDAVSASRVVLGRPSTPAQRLEGLHMASILAFNRGRPTEAHRHLRQALELARQAETGPWSGAALGAHYRLVPLYWGRDSLTTASMTSSPSAGPDGYDAGSLDPNARAQLLCAEGQRQFWHGETAAGQETLNTLQGIQDPVAATTAASCAVLLQALQAALSKRKGAASAVARFDSLLQKGPYHPMELWAPATLLVAALWEMLGEVDRAATALRRRPYHWRFSTLYLSSYLREEGRLATQVGDRERAIRAYRHYLALRSDPEPAAAPEVELVRDELARLVGEDAGS